MAAIITDDFRKNTAQQIIDEIAAGTNKYYIGIGKSDPWTDTATDEDVVGFSPPLPDGSIREREETKNNLIGLLEVNRTSRVIPRIEFQLGQIYKRYDPSDPTVFIPTVSGNNTLQPCYAVFQDKLYVCLRNKADASNPDGVTAGQSDEPQTDSTNDYILDGGASGSNYQWAYIADVNPATTGFNTSQFIEVGTSDVAAATTAASTTGIIYGVKMTSFGQNYSSNTVVNIIGNNADIGGGGSGLTPGGSDLTVTITNGAIEFVDIAAGVIGTGYTEASIVFTDSTGSGAEGVVMISPLSGFGHNPAKQLPSYYVGLESSLAGTLEGDAPVIPYRQVSLLKGTAAVIRGAEGDLGGGESVYEDDEALDTLQYFEVASGSLNALSGVTSGDIIEVDPDGAGTAENIKAFVDYFDATNGNNHLFFHQNNNDLINKKTFPGSGSLRILDRETGAELLGTTAYTSVVTSEYNQGAGSVLFYENRTKITRSTQQTEDIKLVIQL